MTVMVIDKMVLVKTFQSPEKRVTFALNSMDRGEGSDIGLMCCKRNRMEVGEN